jgi:hypothetical protein
MAWFLGWYKSNGLHKIKSKPLVIIQLTAQQEQEVRKWFKAYTTILAGYRIKRKNIVNIDKAGFCVGCAKG